MVREGRRPQIFVQLDPADKEQVEQLAELSGQSVSALAGLWVRRGLAGAYASAHGLSPADQVAMDRLTDLAAKLPRELAAQAVSTAHRVDALQQAERAVNLAVSVYGSSDGGA
jgi:molybdopterin synthase catalytic subunit